MREYSYTRYLSAKKTVDDRALNKDVFGRLRAEIAAESVDVLHVLEIGAGLGTMVARLIDWQLAKRVRYTLLDSDAKLLGDSRDWLAGWANKRGCEQTGDRHGIHIRDSNGIDWSIGFVQADIREYLDRGNAVRPSDLLIANAFLDLVDVPAVLPRLAELVRNGGLYWFSINFDGDTIFEPGHPDDEKLLDVYHRSMDERVRDGQPAGDSKTGRHLFGQLRAAGASIFASGSSDWVVHAENGRYPDDEAYFVQHIIYTVDQELAQHAVVDKHALSQWVRLRHEQIDRGELVYIAHQIDFCGRFG